MGVYLTDGEREYVERLRRLAMGEVCVCGLTRAEHVTRHYAACSQFVERRLSESRQDS